MVVGVHQLVRQGVVDLLLRVGDAGGRYGWEARHIRWAAQQWAEVDSLGWEWLISSCVWEIRVGDAPHIRCEAKQWAVACPASLEAVEGNSMHRNRTCELRWLWQMTTPSGGRKPPPTCSRLTASKMLTGCNVLELPPYKGVGARTLDEEPEPMQFSPTTHPLWCCCCRLERPPSCGSSDSGGNWRH